MFLHVFGNTVTIEIGKYKTVFGPILSANRVSGPGSHTTLETLDK